VRTENTGATVEMASARTDRAGIGARRGVQLTTITPGGVVTASRAFIPARVWPTAGTGVRQFVDERLAQPVQFRARHADAAAQLVQRRSLRARAESGG
jgi:hypothetical protein